MKDQIGIYGLIDTVDWPDIQRGRLIRQVDAQHRYKVCNNDKLSWRSGGARAPPWTCHCNLSFVQQSQAAYLQATSYNIATL